MSTTSLRHPLTIHFLSDGRPDLPFLSELSEELTKLLDRGPAG